MLSSEIYTSQSPDILSSPPTCLITDFSDSFFLSPLHRSSKTTEAPTSVQGESQRGSSKASKIPLSDSPSIYSEPKGFWIKIPRGPGKGEMLRSWKLRGSALDPYQRMGFKYPVFTALPILTKFLRCPHLVKADLIDLCSSYTNVPGILDQFLRILVIILSLPKALLH